MKFSVYTDEFKDAILKVEKARAKKSTVEVLENIKMSIENNKCILFASDLEQFVKTEIEVFDKTDDIFFIFRDTKTLIKAMKFFKESVINFDFENENIKIQCGDKKATLATIKSDNFPDFPKVEGVDVYNYNANKLSERFNLIKYAVGKNIAKPILTGIHFNNNDMVSCDGYRLAINSDDILNTKNPFIVAENTLKLCNDILEQDITISVNNKYIQIKNKNTSIVGRLLDGVYVDYKRVIPQNSNKIECNIKSFADNLKYLKTFLDTKYDPVVWKNDRLILKNSSGIYEGDMNVMGSFDYSIGFNCEYMLESLSQFKAESINILMGDRNVQPMLFKDENNTAILLPINPKSYNSIEEKGQVA